MCKNYKSLFDFYKKNVGNFLNLGRYDVTFN